MFNFIDILLHKNMNYQKSFILIAKLSADSIFLPSIMLSSSSFLMLWAMVMSS